MTITAAPHAPVTREMHPLHARGLTVSDVVDLSPVMRRITFTLDEGDAAVPTPAMAPTDHIKLAFPDAAGELRAPRVENDRPVRPAGEPPILRDYTVRAAAPGSVVIEFVLHEHGPAGRWARAAQVGDRLASIGPRGSVHFPTTYSRYVLGGDETALPAISRWLEELPDGAQAEVVLEVADASARQALPACDAAQVRWVYRSEQESLADAITETRLDADTFVFVAGEATQLKNLRRYLLRHVGLDRAQVDIDGYWKQGTANLDHHAPLDDED